MFGKKHLSEMIAKFERERLACEQRRRERHARRVAKGTAAKPRPTCRCPAYFWPHRPGGGDCRWPDAPHTISEAKASNHANTAVRRRGTTRRELMRLYGLHPIRDRKRIERWMPKLYVAYCRRHGFPWGYAWLGGYVPAMLVTADGAPKDHKPDNSPEFWQHLLSGTERRITGRLPRKHKRAT